MALREQMEMFEDGGLKDEGGMVDEVSGNDVPPGSTREEVRDDIPAQLSEGEFVFPADVVRYIGLEKLMKMRQQAKQGLKTMEDMGQMGNSEEATMPDDLPFDETDLDTEDLPFDESDLDTEDDLEYNTGGVIEGQQEVYAPGNFGNLVTPNVPEVENVRYYNEQTKQVRMIPHLINADGSIGNTIYPVPKGFVPQAEAVEEPVKEEKQSGGTQEQQDDNNDNDDPTGDLGGARTTIGGTEYAVQYNFDGTVGLQSLDNFKATGQRNFQTVKSEIAEAIKTQTTGQLAQLGKVKGLSAAVVAELGKKIGIKTPRYDKLNAAIKKSKTATTFLSKQKAQNIFDIDLALKDAKVKDPAVARVDDLTRAQVRSIDEGIRTGGGIENYQLGLKASDIAKAAEQDRLDKEKKEEQRKQRQISLSFKEQKRARERIAKNKAAQEKAEKEGRITGREAGQSMGGSDDGGYTEGKDFDSNTGFGSDISTAVGGLIPKKKKKTKKMKQGGLASR